MADTHFVDQQTVITAEWLNSINDGVYNPGNNENGTVANPLKNRLEFSLEDFGAKGDGFTDDTDAINYAIAQCRLHKFKLYGNSQSTYLISNSIEWAGANLTFVQFDGRGCTFKVVDGATIFAFELSGISTQYSSCGLLRDFTIDNTQGASQSYITGGIRANYSGLLKLEDVTIITNGTGIYGDERISHSYMRCFITGTDIRCKYGIYGLSRNQWMEGGRIYAANIAAHLYGDDPTFRSTNIEFSLIAFYSRAMTSANIDACHIETTPQLLNNSDILPDLTDVAWNDTGGTGTSISGTVNFNNCHYVLPDTSITPAIVLKSSSGFIYGLSWNGAAFNTSLWRIAQDFAPSNPASVVSGTRLILGGSDVTQPDYGVFPNDAFSVLIKSTQNSFVTSNFQSDTSILTAAKIGKGVSASVINGGHLDVPTGTPQYAGALINLGFRAAAIGYEYAVRVPVTQSYDQYKVPTLDGCIGAGSANSDFTITSPAASTLRITNNSGSTLTIQASINVEYLYG